MLRARRDPAGFSIACLEHEVVDARLAVGDRLEFRISEEADAEISAGGVHFPVAPAVASLAGRREGAEAAPLESIGRSCAVIPERKQFCGFVEGHLHGSFGHVGTCGNVLRDVIEVIRDADEIESTHRAIAVEFEIHVVHGIRTIGDGNSNADIGTLACGVADIDDDLPVLVVAGTIVAETEHCVIVFGCGARDRVIQASSGLDAFAFRSGFNRPTGGVEELCIEIITHWSERHGGLGKTGDNQECSVESHDQKGNSVACLVELILSALGDSGNELRFGDKNDESLRKFLLIRESNALSGHLVKFLPKIV